MPQPLPSAAYCPFLLLDALHQWQYCSVSISLPMAILMFLYAQRPWLLLYALQHWPLPSAAYCPFLLLDALHQRQYCSVSISLPMAILMFLYAQWPWLLLYATLTSSQRCLLPIPIVGRIASVAILPLAILVTSYCLLSSYLFPALLIAHSYCCKHCISGNIA